MPASLKISCPTAVLLADARTTAAGYTPRQRVNIVTILRDALKSDQSIEHGPWNRLEYDHAEGNDAAARLFIAVWRDSLFESNDPRAWVTAATIALVAFFDTRRTECRHAGPMLTRLHQAGSGLRVVDEDMPMLGPASTLGSRALFSARSHALIRSCVAPS